MKNKNFFHMMWLPHQDNLCDVMVILTIDEGQRVFPTFLSMVPCNTNTKNENWIPNFLRRKGTPGLSDLNNDRGEISLVTVYVCVYPFLFANARLTHFSSRDTRRTNSPSDVRNSVIHPKALKTEFFLEFSRGASQNKLSLGDFLRATNYTL